MKAPIVSAYAPSPAAAASTVHELANTTQGSEQPHCNHCAARLADNSEKLCSTCKLLASTAKPKRITIDTYLQATRQYEAAQRNANRLQQAYQQRVAEARQLFPTPLGGWGHLCNPSHLHYADASRAAIKAQQEASSLYEEVKFQYECLMHH